MDGTAEAGATNKPASKVELCPAAEFLSLTAPLILSNTIAINDTLGHIVSQSRPSSQLSGLGGRGGTETLAAPSCTCFYSRDPCKKLAYNN
jgi:hypothetical protein